MKGWYSGKGKKAKEKLCINPLTLPPRSPALMPLDYAIWAEIGKQMIQSDPDDVETKEVFLARLKKTAMSLPKTWVQKQLKRMKANLEGIVKAKGFHSKTD